MNLTTALVLTTSWTTGSCGVKRDITVQKCWNITADWRHHKRGKTGNVFLFTSIFCKFKVVFSDYLCIVTHCSSLDQTIDCFLWKDLEYCLVNSKFYLLSLITLITSKLSTWFSGPHNCLCITNFVCQVNKKKCWCYIYILSRKIWFYNWTNLDQVEITLKF